MAPNFSTTPWKKGVQPFMELFHGTLLSWGGKKINRQPTQKNRVTLVNWKDHNKTKQELFNNKISLFNDNNMFTNIYKLKMYVRI